MKITKQILMLYVMAHYKATAPEAQPDKIVLMINSQLTSANEQMNTVAMVANM